MSSRADRRAEGYRGPGATPAGHFFSLPTHREVVADAFCLQLWEPMSFAPVSRASSAARLRSTPPRLSSRGQLYNMKAQSHFGLHNLPRFLRRNCYWLSSNAIGSGASTSLKINSRSSRSSLLQCSADEHDAP